MHWTRIAKDISYVLAPILIVILLASFMSVAAVFDSGKIDGKDYYSSTCFSDQYFERISDELNKLIEIEKKSKEEIAKIRKKAILTAYTYRDSEIARKYLNDVLNW